METTDEQTVQFDVEEVTPEVAIPELEDETDAGEQPENPDSPTEDDLDDQARLRLIKRGLWPTQEQQPAPEVDEQPETDSSLWFEDPEKFVENMLEKKLGGAMAPQHRQQIEADVIEIAESLGGGLSDEAKSKLVEALKTTDAKTLKEYAGDKGKAVEIAMGLNQQFPKKAKPAPRPVGASVSSGVNSAPAVTSRPVLSQDEAIAWEHWPDQSKDGFQRFLKAYRGGA